MTESQFKSILLMRIEKLNQGDESEQEGAGELGMIVDFMEGNLDSKKFPTLDSICNWVGERNLCDEDTYGK